jgi:hypothetical protein
MFLGGKYFVRHAILLWQVACGVLMNSVLLSAQTNGIQLEVGSARAQRFCLGDAAVHTQLIDFNVHFISNDKIGFDLLENNGSPTEILIYKTLEDIKMQKVDAHWYSTAIPFSADTTSKRTQHVSAGRSVDSILAVSLIVGSNPTPVPGTLIPGVYFIEFLVPIRIARPLPTVPKGRNASPARSQRITVKSGPVRVEIPDSPVLKDCSN